VAVDHGEPLPGLAGPGAEQSQGRETGVGDLVDTRDIDDQVVVTGFRRQEAAEERGGDAPVEGGRSA
jgi:hypothetical protein